MKRTILILVALLSAGLAWAQFPGGLSGRAFGDRAFSVTVTVVDSLTAEAVPFASVYLQPEKDTIITNFTLSDSQGKAIVDKIVRGSYKLNVEMMGYRPYRKQVYLTGRADLGKILLQEDAELLKAAKVTGAVRALEVRQDTLIYHADAFSVRETDVLRDLLRQMPGVEVGENGSVKVQGATVSQITVNGRTFFMGDNQAALDNLPAKAVDKVTVTDKNADVEKMTGIRQGTGDAGKKMDVSLRQEYSEGLFGNLQGFGGASLPDRDQDEMVADIPFLWNGSGMLSWYNKKDQLTLLGRGQNVGSGNDITSFRLGSGITTGGQAGANFTTSRIKKMDTGVSIYYNGTSREDASRSNTQDFPLYGDPVETDRLSASLRRQHRATASIELRSKGTQKIGFAFSPVFSFSDVGSSGSSSSSSLSGGEKTNASSSVNDSHSRTLGASGALMVSARLSKKGRSFRVLGNYALQGSQGTARDYSLTEFAGSHGSQERDLHYKNAGGNGSGLLSFFYVEPLAEKWLLQSGLEGSLRRSSQNKAAFNADGSPNAYYSNLSVNNGASGRGSVLLQYRSTDASSFQAGFSLNADHLYSYSEAQERISEIGEGEWLWNVAPELNFMTSYFSLSYRGRSSQPSHERMEALPNIVDPLRISTGNRYLRPEFQHTLDFTTRRDPRPGKKNTARLNVRATITQNPFVTAIWYDADRIRYSIPVNARKPALNLSGYFSGSARLGKKEYWRVMYGLHAGLIRQTNYQPAGTLPGLDLQSFDYDRFMDDFWGNASGSRFYGGESGFRESVTRQLTFSPNVELTYNRSNSLRVTLGNRLSGSHAWYSLDGMADTHTWIYGLTLDARYTTPHKFLLGTYYAMQRYFGFSDSFSKWTNNLNFSLEKEYRSMTFSVQLRDVLNSGLTVSHSVGATGTTDSYSLSLGRHFLAGMVWRFGRMGNKQLMSANRSANEIKQTFDR